MYCRGAKIQQGQGRGITGCLWKRFCTGIAQAFPGAICRSGLATGRTFTVVTEGGLKAAFGRRVSNIWRRMPTTNTR